MKILCVIQRYHPVIGGAENLIKSLMDHLSEHHEITVYTTTARDIEAFWDKKAAKIMKDIHYKYLIKRFDITVPTQIKFDETVESFYYASNHPGPFCTELWKEMVLKKIDYDLIVAASYPYDHIIPAYIASKKWKIPIIIYPMIHQEFTELFLNSIKLTMLNNSEAIIVNTQSEKQILVKLGVESDKIFQNFPITTQTDTANSNPQGFRDQFLPNPHGKMVLFAGSKSFVKGLMNLIDAMKKIWSTRDDVFLVLMGPPTQEYELFFEKLSDKIKSKIIDLGIANEQNKKNAFAACDIFALPSKSESFGLVYVEAWAFEKPVIGCNIASVSEIIEDKKNGLLVNFGNIKQLSECLLYLINNPSICEKLGKDGQKKSISFSSQDNLKNFEDKCISVVESFKNK